MTVTATQVLRPRGPQIERIAENRAKVVIEPLERTAATPIPLS